MINRLKFLWNRLRERLWVRPLAMCLLSVAVAFAAHWLDRYELAAHLPEIAAETLEILLKIVAASMLVIATFAVGSMVSSYASAAGSATPRAFSVIVSDDVSQNALSAFLGAFIYSLVALIALRSGIYGHEGRFALLCLTVLVFAGVIVTFVRWVDCIARLGQLRNTITRVEAVAVEALTRRARRPTMGGRRIQSPTAGGEAVYSRKVGYVQRVDIEMLHEVAEREGLRLRVAALPGTFAAPGRPLAYVRRDNPGAQALVDHEPLRAAFELGESRLFDEDPRFGLVVLSEIAGRALSPGINDPGTAIDIIGTLVRLFVRWDEEKTVDSECPFERIEVPELIVQDLFDDAFLAIGRDGAGTVEVATRLQKALHALSTLDDSAVREAAGRHARLALQRAEQAMKHPEDLAQVRAAAQAAVGEGTPG